MSVLNYAVSYYSVCSVLTSIPKSCLILSRIDQPQPITPRKVDNCPGNRDVVAFLGPMSSKEMRIFNHLQEPN